MNYRKKNEYLKKQSKFLWNSDIFSINFKCSIYISDIQYPGRVSGNRMQRFLFALFFSPDASLHSSSSHIKKKHCVLLLLHKSGYWILDTDIQWLKLTVIFYRLFMYSFIMMNKKKKRKKNLYISSKWPNKSQLKKSNKKNGFRNSTFIHFITVKT